MKWLFTAWATLLLAWDWILVRWGHSLFQDWRAGLFDVATLLMAAAMGVIIGDLHGWMRPSWHAELHPEPGPRTHRIAPGDKLVAYGVEPGVTYVATFESKSDGG